MRLNKSDYGKTIEEIAHETGCKPSNVRRHIQSRRIDRRGDEQIRKFKQLKKWRRKLEKVNWDWDRFRQVYGCTLRDIAKKEKLAVSTTHRYLARKFSIESHIDSTKESQFQRGKNTDYLQSVSRSQHTILRSIITLYIPSGKFDCDLTYSKGGFYKGKELSAPVYKFDKYPQSDDVSSLDDAYNLEHGTLDSVVVDLPFIIRDSSSQRSVVDQRYKSFRNVEEMETAYLEMMTLASNLLKTGAILVVKTQDVNSGGKQIWVHQIVERLAEQLNFEIEDIFINYASHVMARADYSVQKHARKFHSYFYVLRKN